MANAPLKIQLSHFELQRTVQAYNNVTFFSTTGGEGERSGGHSGVRGKKNFVVAVYFSFCKVAQTAPVRTQRHITFVSAFSSQRIMAPLNAPRPFTLEALEIRRYSPPACESSGWYASFMQKRVHLRVTTDSVACPIKFHIFLTKIIKHFQR